MSRFLKTRDLILVTGCDGFVGRYLIGELIKKEINILGVDKEIRYRDKCKMLELLELDILKPRNISKITRCIGKYKAAGVNIVHLIGYADVEGCQRYEKLAYDLNVRALMNILQVSRECEIRRIIFSSSALVYGTGYQDLIKEDFPVHPDSMYAKTKLEAENYLTGNSKAGVILRTANIYGRGMKANTVIPTILGQLGNGYIRLKDYDNVRDFIYIRDVVGAISACLFSRCNFNVYNVGTSMGYSIYELTNKIAKLLNKKRIVSGIEHNNYSRNKIILSNKRIKNDLHWKPAYTLEAGLKEMVGLYA